MFPEGALVAPSVVLGHHGRMGTDMLELVLAGTQAALEEGVGSMAWVHDTDDGLRVCVYRMLWGNSRLCVGPRDAAYYDAGYCYDGVERGIVAAVEWVAGGLAGEPGGWKKNLQTGEYGA
jgi:hypothetical protein